MRRLTVLVVLLGALAGACAPRLVPAPTISTPQYPEYVQPVVSASMGSARLAEHHDRAWRFLQTGDLRNAQREVEEALRLEPEFPPSEAAAGYVALAQGNEDTALAYFDRALERETSYVPALVGRGHSLAELGREAEAIAAYQLALGVDPTLPDLRRRADVLRFRVNERLLEDAREAASAGRLDVAADAYATALASSPDSAFLYRELADVEARLGNPTQALAHFTRATELDPSDATSFFRIGQLREAQGELQEAISAYETAASLDSNPSIVDALDGARERYEFSILPEEYRAIESAPAVTRAGLAALIGVRLAEVVQGSASTAPVVLTDVRSTWAEPWIMRVTQAGVMEGYANHTFQPETSVARIDLARAIAELLPRVASPAELRAWQGTRMTFGDLASAHLAYPAASTAVASGAMETSGNALFEPSRPISGREALAAIERLEELASASGVRPADRR
ncbi:MAG: tetratricopeptide repeat protein [Vicinamibacterales bacterium]